MSLNSLAYKHISKTKAWESIDVNIDISALNNIYNAKAWDQLSATIIEIMRQIDQSDIDTPSDQCIELFSQLLEFIFKAFENPEYVINRPFQSHMISCSVAISNMATLTHYQNTDQCLEILQKEQPEHKVKHLTLYSHRNSVRLELDNYFKDNNEIATYWWSIIMSDSLSNCTKAANEHMIEIATCDAVSKYFSPLVDGQLKTLHGPFFRSTYLKEGIDRPIKRTINKACQNLIDTHPQIQKIKHLINNANTSLLPQHDRHKVLVISDSFFKAHAVYKTVSPYVFSLKENYDINLFVLNDKRQQHAQYDNTNFNKIFFLQSDKQRLSILEMVSIILHEKPSVIIYPDIGFESLIVLLANFQLAPIQLTCSGHPSSTFGSKVQYYLSSRETESIDHLKENYDETPVLVPGLGLIPVIGDHTPGEKKLDNDTIQITLAWSPPKLNFDFLSQLSTISKNSSKHVKFVISGLDRKHVNYPSFCQDTAEIFGVDHVETIPFLQHDEYLKNIENSHFAIESFPFGGFNRTIDCLVCNTPMLVLEGTKIYNRLSSLLYRKLGLEELICSSIEELIEKSIHLSETPQEAKALSDKIATISKDDILKAAGNPAYFKKAIDYLIELHQEHPQSNRPKDLIFIDEDPALN